ncbi:hypothetical protein KKB99_07790 [bacterium]|nr:hypothetical protein [bacterium]
MLADQVVAVKSKGIEIAISSDSHAHIALLIEEKKVEILQISSGIFDRYWDFLSLALKSEFGLKLKVKDKDEIYEVSGEAVRHEKGSKIIMRFSKAMRESDFMDSGSSPE